MLYVGNRRGSFPSSSHWWDTRDVLGPVLGSLVQGWNRLTQVSPEKGQKDDEGLESSITWGEAEHSTISAISSDTSHNISATERFLSFLNSDQPWYCIAKPTPLRKTQTPEMEGDRTLLGSTHLKHPCKLNFLHCEAGHGTEMSHKCLSVTIPSCLSTGSPWGWTLFLVWWALLAYLKNRSVGLMLIQISPTLSHVQNF